MAFLLKSCLLWEKINLRGDSKDRDFMSNTGSVLDILIPTEPTKIQNNDLQVIWLSPNEWLLNFLIMIILLEYLKI